MVKEDREEEEEQEDEGTVLLSGVHACSCTSSAL